MSSNSKSFAICAELGSSRMPLMTVSFGSDGSFYVSGRVEPRETEPIYWIVPIQFPVDKVGMGKRIPVDGPTYYSRNKPKLSYHAQSGLFQVSSAAKGVRSGFDAEANGKPKGISNYCFHPHKVTNDGGPIVAGKFWGLNNMPTTVVRSSTPVVFHESHLRDQTMGNSGAKPSVAVDVFHFLKNKNPLQYIDNDWARYPCRYYKRPLLTRIIDPGDEHQFLLGVSCLLMRCNESSLYGYRLGGGPGIIDPQTGCCLNTFIMLEAPNTIIPKDAICVDHEPRNLGSP